jgi:glycine/D-amino acid oxidase-like deaminating enzyme
MSTQRIVIIGGGITGALCAWELRRAGHTVTLLEARHIGAGSSSRTAAGIRQQFSTPETVLGMRYAVDLYRRFPELVGGGRSPLVQNGYLFLLEGAQAWEAAVHRVQMQRVVGLAEVELLSPQQTVERFPWVDGEMISGATWCPTDGFLRPEIVYNDALEAARRDGAALHQSAEVTAARHQGGRLQAVQARGLWFEGDVFIDATNAWSPRLGRLLQASDLPIAPLKRYLWFFERGEAMDPATLQAMPLVITPPGAYCRPENAGSLMAGFAHPAEPEPDFDYEDQDRIEPAFFHRAGAEGKAVEAWLALASYLPAVGEFAGITATTCGYYGTTPDHNPFLGFDPAVPNLLRLVGFSGHGAMFGPFSSAVALNLIQAGHDLPEIGVLGRSASLAPFRLDRPLSGHGERMVI